MTTGIQVLSSNGNIQITEEFRNLQFIKKTTITLVNQYSATTATVTLGNTTVFVAFRCSDGSNTPVSMNHVDVANGVSTVTFFAGIIGGSKASTTVTYYEFGYPVVSSGSYFEIYNTSGQLVFSDNDKYMKVLGSYSGTVDRGNFSTNTFVINSISCNTGVITAIITGTTSRLWYHAITTSSHVYFNQVFVFGNTSIVNQLNVVGSSDGDPTGYTAYEPSYNFIVIDVTNL